MQILSMVDVARLVYHTIISTTIHILRLKVTNSINHGLPFVKEILFVKIISIGNNLLFRSINYIMVLLKSYSSEAHSVE